MHVHAALWKKCLGDLIVEIKVIRGRVTGTFEWNIEAWPEGSPRESKMPVWSEKIIERTFSKDKIINGLERVGFSKIEVTTYSMNDQQSISVPKLIFIARK